MSLISVIIFACLTLMVSASISMMCPESIPTISIVPRCPSNAMEWKLAAERKKCDVLGKIQNCTEEDKFMYHCVLNRDATMLLEVCAPMHYMSGYCARFSELHKRIINDPGLDCAQFDHPCPTRFQSNESYKYQACYSNIPKLINSSPAYHHQANQTGKDNSTAAIVNTFLAIFVIITVVLIILLLVGFKLHWIEFNRDGKHEIRTGEEEGFLFGNSEHIKDQTDENDEEMKISNLHVELSKATEETDSYDTLVLNSDAGLTMVVLINDESGSKLLSKFKDIVLPLTRYSGLSFSFLRLESYIGWYQHLLEDSVGHKVRMENININNCIGTVLALNGIRKYYYIYQPKKARKWIRQNNKNVPSAIGMFDSDENSDSDQDSRVILVEELLDGLLDWFDKVFDGSQRKIRITAWPDLRAV